MNKKSYCTKKDNPQSFNDTAAIGSGQTQDGSHVAKIPPNNKWYASIEIFLEEVVWCDDEINDGRILQITCNLRLQKTEL